MILRSSSGSTRFWAIGLAIVVLGACLWWGVHPPRSAEGYRHRAGDTVDLLRSDVQTARIWLVAVADGRVTRSSAVVALTEAESGASARSTAFAAYQPPGPEVVGVRARVSAAGDRVVGLLGRIRVEARDGRWDMATARVDELEALAEDLQSLAEAVRS